MGGTVDLTRTGELGIITINHPPVNALSPAVAGELTRAVERVGRNSSVAGAVMVGEGRGFIAGADIHELEKMASGGRRDPAIRKLIERIENCPKPIVAAIHGPALGGGLEVAMAAHYRVASATAALGQPEVNLGLIPGAGGTQRLPRLVGVARALRMCWTGESISGAEALELGLVDRVVAGKLLHGALEFLRARLDAAKTHRATSERDQLLAAGQFDPGVFEKAREEAASRAHALEAPLAAIDAVEAATQLPFAAALRREAQLFDECLRSDQCRALIYLFLSERKAAKPEAAKPEAAKPAGEPRAIRGVVLVGDGPEAAALAGAASQTGLRMLGPEALGEADIAIEAVSVDYAAKRDALIELAKACRPDALLITLTQAPMVDLLAQATSRPLLVVGAHLAPPRLIELVRGSATGEQSVATALALAKRLGKIGVAVANTPDFVVERLRKRCRAEGVTEEVVCAALSEIGANANEIVERGLYALLNEGYRMLDEGVVSRASDIDVAAVHGLGFPRHHGGPMWFGATSRLATVYDRICEFERRYGKRWRPAAGLVMRMRQSPGV